MRLPPCPYALQVWVKTSDWKDDLRPGWVKDGQGGFEPFSVPREATLRLLGWCWRKKRARLSLRGMKWPGVTAVPLHAFTFKQRLDHIAQGMVHHAVPKRRGGDQAQLGVVDMEK